MSFTPESMVVVIVDPGDSLYLITLGEFWITHPLRHHRDRYRKILLLSETKHHKWIKTPRLWG